MDCHVVAVEVKPPLGNYAVVSASGLLLCWPERPLILTSCLIKQGSQLAVTLPNGLVVEAQLVASARLGASSEAFRSLASRGWRCGNKLFDISMTSALQLTLLRPSSSQFVADPSSSKKSKKSKEKASLWLSFSEPVEQWIGQRVLLHSAPFGARAGSFWSQLRVVMRGVISNLSSPPGLILTDAPGAESSAGGALVLEGTNEVVGLLAPTLCGSSGEAVALGIVIPMPVVLDTMLDDAACRAQLCHEDLASLPSPPSTVSLPPSEVRQGVALLWLDSGSWASAIVLSSEGHLLTCAHLLLGNSWMELRAEGKGLQQQPRAPSRCRGSCFAEVQGKIVSVTFEADVLRIFDGFLDAALLRVRPERSEKEYKFNPALWNQRADPLEGTEVWAVGHGLFGPGCPWKGPAATSGLLCKVVRASSGRRAILQSSAAVHRGCSGGALVANGQLLGMVTTNVKQQDGFVMPRVNFILPVGLLSPVCTYLENLKVLPATEALARLTEELRPSAADEEERSFWRLDVERLKLPSRRSGNGMR
ncbi:unnamed protein product [Durusdinium trenchii]|uniref:Peroxisomal leader peptide-processing protease n=1 Tax=Durusdinium trenchii TaxID=1381693 RepID=A0ABP0M5M1_9DINO